jgi:capsular polysaccharide biosynthesis protein
VNDPDQTLTWGPRAASDLRDRLAAYEDSADFEDPGGPGSGAGLVNVAYLWNALRRGWRLMAVLAIVGLIIGAGYSVLAPAQDQATTTVLLYNDPTDNPTTALATNTGLAASLPVATAVVQQLNLPMTANSFLATYTATATTPQIVLLTVSASSSDEAVARATALAQQYLAFRASYEQAAEKQTSNDLQDQVTQDQASVDTLATELQAAPLSQHKALSEKLTQAQNELQSSESDIQDTRDTLATLVNQEVSGSRVLNPAQAVKSSTLKSLLMFSGGGLAGGYVLGAIILIFAAILSDKLRRRDDIAYALQAPVGLSVGPLGKGRMPGSGGSASSRRRDSERVAEYLRKALPGSQGKGGLAVVAVDDPSSTAQVVAGLVESIAKLGRVVLADLSEGAPAARLLGVNASGVATVERGGARFVVVVPAADDVTPVGPFRASGPASGDARPDEKVIAACSHADLVLSLVTLDPAHGGEFVGTWATEAVALVTAGRSTATKVHAAGEMVRLGGTKLSSVIVVNADKNDETLGASVSVR